MRIEDFTKPAGAAAARRTAPAWTRPTWELPIDHFSHTQLVMSEVCPEQYRQRYILGKKEPPAQALLTGRLVHGGVQFGLETKILTGDDPHVDDMLTHYHDAIWPQTLESYGGQGEVIWDDRPEQVRSQGALMIKAYHPTIGRLEPEATEQEFRLDLGFQVPIIGYVDVVQKNSRPSIDLKTQQRRRSDLRPDWRAQARTYQLAVPLPVDFHVVTKTKAPQVITGLDEEGLVETYHFGRVEETRRRIGQALSAIEHYWHLYGPDETWPTRGVLHDWRCSYCAWKSICPAWTE